MENNNNNYHTNIGLPDDRRACLQQRIETHKINNHHFEKQTINEKERE